MQNQSLYWHDYETWGVNPSVDRPVQFAGIRTNLDLEPIADPDMWYCKPAVDVLPHPVAVKVTGITPNYADQHGLIEPEFMHNVQACLGAAGTCGVGYNSLRFDDEVTRYGLYRNFFDPYAREWQHGNSRWDIVDMVRTCYALRPEGIEWPLVNGVPSFKLENLTAANGLTHGKAHDALSDVEAAISLARLIKNNHPVFYQHIFDLRIKSAVAAAIDVANRKPFLHISSKFPASRGCAGLVVPLAFHPTNKNAVITYDLSVDPEDLLGLDPEAIAERVFTKEGDLVGGEKRIPLKAIHINKCPIVLTSKLLTNDIAERLSINKAVAEVHWRKLLSGVGCDTLGHRVAQAFTLASFDARDADQSLYQGFLPNTDKLLLEKVRSASPEQLSTEKLHFQDERYNALLIRYKARHYPESLSDSERVEWGELCNSRWFGNEPDHLSMSQFELALNAVYEEGVDSALRGKLEDTHQWVKGVTNSLQV